MGNNIEEITFENDPTKVKFFANQVSDLRSANKMIETDFSGSEFDPNFEVSVFLFASYLEEFTNTKWDEFSDE